MKRSQGAEGILLVECINPHLDKWRVRWDVQPYVNEEGEEQGVTFLEEEFLRKPTIGEVKEAITRWINMETDSRILSGFEYEGMAVWLSTENQFNYKAAYDLAVQSGGQSLPVMFKFGTDEETVYHTFTTIEELTAFYLASVAWVQTCLAEGWAQKDGLDTSAYEETLAGEEEQRKDVTEG